MKTVTAEASESIHRARCFERGGQRWRSRGDKMDECAVMPPRSQWEYDYGEADETRRAVYIVDRRWGCIERSRLRT